MAEADDEVLTGWALAARAGDRDALESFIRATQRDVWRLCAHLVGPGAADDLAQETYLRVLGGLRRFAGRASARTWLLAIARHVAVDHLRARNRRPRPAEGLDWETAVGSPRDRSASAPFEEVVETNLLLGALDADRREALVLTQVLGLTYTEAAQVTGCPVGTIRSRVARARDDLVRWSEEPARRRASAGHDGGRDRDEGDEGTARNRG
jgi:RNA polymerase sigma-70 factor (ECF subfamily)